MLAQKFSQLVEAIKVMTQLVKAVGIAESLGTPQEARDAQELSYAKKGLFTALASGVFWGLDGVLLGIALAMAPFTSATSLLVAPLVGSALHDGLAGFYLLIYNMITGRWRELLRTLRTRPGKIVCLAAVFGGPLAMGGYLLGIQLAGPAYAMGLSALYPVVGAILAQIFLKEKITTRVWMGIAACVIGGIVIGYVPPEDNGHPYFYLGLGFALLAAIGWGIEGVLSTFGMEMVDPDVAINLREATSCVVSLVGVLPLIGGLVMFGEAMITPSSLWILAIAAMVGAISYLFWYRAFSMCGVGRTMSLNITYSLWGIVFSWFFTDIAITSNLVFGAIIITIGSILVIANPKEIVTLREKEA